MRDLRQWSGFLRPPWLEIRIQCHQQILSQQGYPEIKHYDWMFQVTWHFSTNQSALFQCIVIDIGPAIIFV